MAEDKNKKGIGAGEIVGGAVVGASVAVVPPAIAGAVVYSDRGKQLLQDVVDAKVGDIINGAEITEAIQKNTANFLKHAPENPGLISNTWGILKAMPTGRKIGLGVVATGAAVGTGWVINKLRNSGNSHVDQIENERAQTGPREK